MGCSAAVSYSLLLEVYGREINYFYFEGKYGKTIELFGSQVYWIDQTDNTYQMPITDGFYDTENHKLFCNQRNSQTATVKICYMTGLIWLDLSGKLK